MNDFDKLENASLDILSLNFSFVISKESSAAFAVGVVIVCAALFQALSIILPMFCCWKLFPSLPKNA